MWVVVATLLVVTGLMALLVRGVLAQRAEDRFLHETTEYVDRLVDRLGDYESLLRGHAAWVQARGLPGGDEWRRLLSDARSLASPRGIGAIGIGQMVAARDKTRFVQTWRAAGDPAFSIHPTGDRPIYSAVTHLASANWQCQPLSGRDIYADDVARQAMERAALTRTAALSGVFNLLPDGSGGIRRGLLLFVPLFAPGVAGLPDDRLAACTGWVFASVVAEDFFAALGEVHGRAIRVEAWAGAPGPANALFDSAHLADGGALAATEGGSRNLRAERQIEVAGQPLVLRFSASADTLTASALTAMATVSLLGFMLAATVYFSMRRFQSFGEKEKARADELQGALREARHRVLALIDNLPFSVWMKDDQGNYLVANRTYAYALGRPLNQLIGRGDERVRNDDDRRAIGELEAAARDSRRPAARVREQPRPAGETTWQEVTCLPVYSGGGLFLGMVGIERDVTVEHRAAETERRARLAAEAASSEKTRFVSMLAHEIRNPLQAAVGCMALLRRQFSDPAGHRLLAAIDTSLLHIRHQLSEAREIARIEAGELQVFETPFQIATLLDDIRISYGPLARERRLVLDTSVAGEVPKVLVGDPEHLYQVLSNLVSNGLKYTQRGVVGVRAEPGGAPGRVRFVVEDTGEGIPPSLMGQLFKAYTRGAQRGAVEGTGLGLTICQRLVEAMRGTITVRSVPGLGSRFEVEIPFSVPQELAGENDAPPPVAADLLAGCRVLLVDDSAITLSVVKELLASAGASVATCGSGAEALAKLESEPDAMTYTAVVTDLRMPEMDGHQLGARLRERWPALRIVALSGDIVGDGAQLNEQGPFSVCLAKPATLAELAAAIRPVFLKPGGDEAVAVDPAIKNAVGMLHGLGDEARQRLCGAFFADQDGSLAQLRRLIDAGELAGLPAVAHSIAGAASFLGLTEIARLTRQLRAAALAGDVDLLSGLAIEFSACIAVEAARVGFVAPAANAGDHQGEERTS